MVVHVQGRAPSGYSSLVKFDVQTAEVLVGLPGKGGLGARQGARWVFTYEALLVEDCAFTTHEGELAGDDLAIANVGQTHVEDGAVVGFVGVVAIGQLGTVEARLDAA